MPTYYIVILCCFCCCFSTAQQFQDLAGPLGISHSYGLASQGGGVSFADFDGDGWDDLSFAASVGDSIAFYKNMGGSFQRIYFNMPMLPDNMKQLIWADIDNDGDEDLLITSDWDDNIIYYNQGNGQFMPYILSAPVGHANAPSFGAALGDYDRDGDLDIYICNRSNLSSQSISNQLFRNNGDGTFTDLSAQYFFYTNYHLSHAVAFFDYNNDLNPDLYTAEDKFDANQLYENAGGGIFLDVGAVSGADLVMEAMCVSVADYDNDGDSDIYISNTPNDGGNQMLRNNGNQTFTEIGDSIGLRYWGYGWSTSFLDYNNDGLLDVYACGANYPARYDNRFYTQQQNGNFLLASNAGFLNDSTYSYSTAVGDYNNDGYSDIAVLNMMPDLHQVWANSGGNKDWVKIRLEGTLSNRNAVGSWLFVYANGQQYSRYIHAGEGYLAQNSYTQLIGLDNAAQVDSLKINWISGLEETFYNLGTYQTYHFVEGAGFCRAGVTMGDSLVYCKDNPFSITLDSAEHWNSYWNYGWAIYNENNTIELHLGHVPGFEGNLDSLVLANAADTLAAGNYWVKALTFDASDSLCAVEIDSVPLRVGPDFNMTIISNPASGPVIADGSLELVLQGDTSMLELFWNTGDSSIYLDSLYAGNYNVTVSDNWGCFLSDSVELTALVPSHLEQLNLELLNIYPNPAGEQLFLEHIPPHADILVYNQQGRCCWHAKADLSAFQISLTDFKQGVYVLCVEYKGERACRYFYKLNE